MSKRRVSFNDLFEATEAGLTLKRKLIIAEHPYEVGDVVTTELEFINDPESFFYIVDPLRVGDTLDGWSPVE